MFPTIPHTIKVVPARSRVPGSTTATVASAPTAFDSVCLWNGVSRAAPMILQHVAGNGSCAIPLFNMTTATTFDTELLQLRQLPKGRKLTTLRIELLNSINIGDTAIFRFLRGYLAAALWSSTDDEGEPLDMNFDITSIATESLLSAWAECSRFIRECETDLVYLNDELNGHNFWLTRSRHGSGFWDERVDDESAEPAMQQLTYASHTFAVVDLYLGDDKNLHFSNEN